MGFTRFLVGLALIGLIYLLAQFIWEAVMHVPGSDPTTAAHGTSKFL